MTVGVCAADGVHVVPRIASAIQGSPNALRVMFLLLFRFGTPLRRSRIWNYGLGTNWQSMEVGSSLHQDRLKD
jgi:hypothetical protein